MRLRVRLPEVRPDEYAVPLACPYGCGGRYFALHERRRKVLSDPTYGEVKVRRYKCTNCGHSFRVNPVGVSQHHRSQRLRGIGILLYVLGLSYGGVVDVLSAFGWQGSRSTIYRDVQAAGEAVARRQQAPRRVQVVSADATYLVCKGKEITVAVALDALAGEVIEVEVVDGESAEALRPFLQRLQHEYGFEVLVSDDHDSYKVLADEMGLEHSICRAHVNRNVARITAELAQQVEARGASPPPGVTRTQEELLTDLEYCQLLIALRPADGERQLLHLFRHYQAAPAPPKGQKASIWYRFRLALLRWATNWRRLTFDQSWNRQRDLQPKQRLDGTNNVAERAIGNWIKERYRSMRTYKRQASVSNLARLIPYLAAHPDQPLLTELLVA
jgi:transposase-like protein